MKSIARFWAKVPFGGRLLLTTCVALCVASVLMVVVSARQEAAEIHADMRGNLANELAVLPGALMESVVVGDFAAVQQFMDRYVRRPLLAEIEFRDSGGVRLLSTDHTLQAESPAWFRELYDFTWVEGVAQVQVGGRSYGELRVCLTPHSLSNRAWHHLENYLAILLVAVLLNMLGIWWLVRTNLAPLQQLEKGANAIGDGQLDVVLAPQGSPEWQHLIRIFNQMTRSLRDSQLGLQASEERLQLAINGVNDGIWDWDIATGRVFWSPKMSEMLGYHPSELQPGLDTLLALMHPDDQSRLQHLLDQHLQGVLPLLSCEFRLRHKNREWRWILGRGVAQRDEQGCPFRMTGSHTDISELVAARHAAEAANVAKSHFLSTMSHEIRTPLNGVLGMLQLLDTTELSHEQQEYTKTAEESAQNLLSILNDILDFSQIESGRLVLEKVSFNLPRSIHDVLHMFGYLAEQKQLGLTVELDPQVPEWVEGDPARLRQVLVNLLGNALKFTLRGQVSVVVSAVAGGVSFCVHDTGVGMSQETQQQLFTPFMQADSSPTRQFGGTGLGLSICKRLIELMGGDISVASELGQGTQFCFTLPLHAMAAPPVEAGLLPEVRQALAGKQILLVEDNPTNQKVVQAMLHKCGIVVTVAHDGEEALRWIADQPFDLVLMDCKMPRMDGFEATRQIRRGNHQPAIPVIALTANAMQSDMEECLAAGMDDFLSKPVGHSQLLAKLAEWLVDSEDQAGAVGQSAAAIVLYDHDSPAQEAPYQRVLARLSAQDVPVFRLEDMLRLVGGSEELLRDVAPGFVADLQGNQVLLQDALMAMEFEKALRLARTLKGLASQVGGQRVRELMGCLEDELQAHREPVPALLAACVTECQALETALDYWLGHASQSPLS